MAGLFRTERTYVLSPQRAERLERAVAARLPARVYAGHRDSWTRTVYLDTWDGDFARRIVDTPSRSTKLRVRRYFPSEPPDDPRVWVEVKHRRGLVVAKTRFATTRAALPALLRGGTAPAHPEQRELARVRGLRGLVPTAVVDYRRRSYESPDGALRLTFDADISTGRVEPDYFEHPRREPQAVAATRPLGDGRVFEVKLRGSVAPPPRWLRELLLGDEPAGYSKAAAALRPVGPTADRYSAEM